MYTIIRITKVYRQQAEVIQNHENQNVGGIAQEEKGHRKCNRAKLGGGQAYDRSSD
jgi:rubrerythrin